MTLVILVPLFWGLASSIKSPMLEDYAWYYRDGRSDDNIRSVGHQQFTEFLCRIHFQKVGLTCFRSLEEGRILGGGLARFFCLTSSWGKCSNLTTPWKINMETYKSPI